MHHGDPDPSETHIDFDIMIFWFSNIDLITNVFQIKTISGAQTYYRLIVDFIILFSFFF